MQCAFFISLSTTLYHPHRVSSVPDSRPLTVFFIFQTRVKFMTEAGSGQRAAGEGRRNLRFAVLGDRRVGSLSHFLQFDWGPEI